MSSNITDNQIRGLCDQLHEFKKANAKLRHDLAERDAEITALKSEVDAGKVICSNALLMMIAPQLPTTEKIEETLLRSGSVDQYEVKRMARAVLKLLKGRK